MRAISNVHVDRIWPAQLWPKPTKYQRLADPLLQSGVVTRNSRVECASKSTSLGKVSLFRKTVSIWKELGAGAATQMTIAPVAILNFKQSPGSFSVLI